MTPPPPSPFPMPARGWAAPSPAEGTAADAHVVPKGRWAVQCGANMSASGGRSSANARDVHCARALGSATGARRARAKRRDTSSDTPRGSAPMGPTHGEGQRGRRAAAARSCASGGVCLVFGPRGGGYGGVWGGMRATKSLCT